jgi:hypothetical protein
MTILTKLKFIRRHEDRKHDLVLQIAAQRAQSDRAVSTNPMADKSNLDDNQGQGQVEEEVFDIPKLSRPPSIFIQMGHLSVVPDSDNLCAAKVHATEPGLDERMAGLSFDDKYQQMIVEAWRERVAQEDILELLRDERHDSLSDGDLQSWRVKQRRLCAVMAAQAKHSAAARSDQSDDESNEASNRRPSSMTMLPKHSSLRQPIKPAEPPRERRSLTILDPKDPRMPYPVISRKAFLEELRAQDRLSFDSKDPRNQLLQPSSSDHALPRDSQPQSNCKH